MERVLRFQETLAEQGPEEREKFRAGMGAGFGKRWGPSRPAPELKNEARERQELGSWWT